jgi:hypothetical protein
VTTAEIQVLRNDLASLKADVREVSHLIEGMLAKLSAAHVELQDNVKRIVDKATCRIDRLPCMAARRKQWKRISR